MQRGDFKSLDGKMLVTYGDLVSLGAKIPLGCGFNSGPSVKRGDFKSLGAKMLVTYDDFVSLGAKIPPGCGLLQVPRCKEVTSSPSVQRCWLLTVTSCPSVQRYRLVAV